MTFTWHRHHPRSDLHEMLHEAVPLDAQEQKILDAQERAFIQRRSMIEMHMQTANRQLSEAITNHPGWTPAVEAAMQHVEQAAADLQRETLVHIFEMRAGLKPEHRAAYDHVLIEALRHGSP
ncbi:hypothetical protein FHR87_003516 [Azomonas macrocytogenes]|uniref:Signaling pathway modulator ZraP n=2 Tax=Azomonas macrocytogenes TaxID=69962 RepID=A0A839T6M6_AZOMA|nr:hypothetical protein [Azomonas macrocytogenes]